MQNWQLLRRTNSLKFYYKVGIYPEHLGMWQQYIPDYFIFIAAEDKNKPIIKNNLGTTLIKTENNNYKIKTDNIGTYLTIEDLLSTFRSIE